MRLGRRGDEVATVDPQRAAFEEQLRQARLNAARRNSRWTELEEIDLVQRGTFLVSATMDRVFKPYNGVVFQTNSVTIRTVAAILRAAPVVTAAERLEPENVQHHEMFERGALAPLPGRDLGDIPILVAHVKDAEPIGRVTALRTDGRLARRNVAVGSRGNHGSAGVAAEADRRLDPTRPTTDAPRGCWRSFTRRS